MLKEKFKIWLKPLIWAIVAAVVARAFVQSYVITDTHMESSLHRGDYIIIDRTAYGWRVPITYIALPFNDNKLPFTNIHSYLKLFTISCHRIAFTEPQRLDVVAYNFPLAESKPIDLRPVKVSRIMALPGDTLVIANKKVFVNSRMIDEKLTNLMFEYRIVTDGTYFTAGFLDSMNIEGKMISDLGVYDFYLTPTKAAFFETLPYVKYVRMVTGYKGYNALKYFPANSSFFGWNKDYFGPVIVPYKGYTVPISFSNIDLYKQIIRSYEGNDLFVDIYKKKVFINGDEAKSYTFKQNYYFLMDDNRDNAFDSRYFGFVPESHLIGKARFVWFSIEKRKGKDDINWSRMLKKIE